MRSTPASKARRFTSSSGWFMKTPTTSGRAWPSQALPSAPAQAWNQGAPPKKDLNDLFPDWEERVNQ